MAVERINNLDYSNGDLSVDCEAILIETKEER